jgi:hypothetical protein
MDLSSLSLTLSARSHATMSGRWPLLLLRRERQAKHEKEEEEEGLLERV